ncbi:MAG: ABC transporter permease [Planctomycetota bacterium]
MNTLSPPKPISRRGWSRRFEYAWDLLVVLVLKELRVRYKRTVLGYAWSLLQPLAFAVVYYVVFKQFLRIPTGDVNYTLFLICGLFSWQWFANGVVSSTVALVGNGPLITKVKFPRVYAVLSGVVNDTIHFLLAAPVVFVFLLAFGHKAHWSWLWLLPALLLVQLTMVMGLSLLLATLNLFLRDLERLVTIAVLMLFHLTPVVYPSAMIPEGYRWILYVNPMGALTVAWREAFLYGRVDPGMVVTSVGMAAGLMLLGVVVFRRMQWRFAEVV